MKTFDRLLYSVVLLTLFIGAIPLVMIAVGFGLLIGVANKLVTIWTK